MRLIIGRMALRPAIWLAVGLCSGGHAVLGGIANVTFESLTVTADTPNNGTYAATDFSTLNQISFAKNLGGAGSGGFTTFYRIQKNGSERGYNSVSQTRFDQKGGVTSADDSLDRFPVSGNPYNNYVQGFEWLLDINESNSGTNEYITISELVVFATYDPGSTNDIEVGTGTLGQGDTSLITNFQNAGATLIHDFNATYHAGGSEQNFFILSDGVSSGSGQADYVFYIPVSLFKNSSLDIDPSEYADYRVWLYLEIGGFNGNLNETVGGASVSFTTSATFEEVAYSPTGTQTVPEARTVIAALALFSLILVRCVRQGLRGRKSAAE